MTKVSTAITLAAMVMGLAAAMPKPRTEPFIPVFEGTTAQSISETVRRALQPPPPPRNALPACACVRG